MEFESYVTKYAWSRFPMGIEVQFAYKEENGWFFCESKTSIVLYEKDKTAFLLYKDAVQDVSKQIEKRRESINKELIQLKELEDRLKEP